jgi:DNA-binding FrmR family transcriptional regulator
MDKKEHKKLEVLQQRLQKLRAQLAGAKKQDDEPGEIERLTREIAAAEAEVKKLKET